MSTIRRLLTLTAGAGTALLLLAATATAAAGTAVLLGRTNYATHVTTLSNSRGVPLSLSAARGAAPLAVNSETKVRHLDADLLDGLDSSSLQRRVTGTCTAGSRMAGIATSGAVTCLREPYSIVWQVLVGADGTATVGHAGVSVAHDNPGDYTVLWTGFPGRGLAYCNGIGRVPVVVSMASAADGSGHIRLSFNASDTAFVCEIVAIA